MTTSTTPPLAVPTEPKARWGGVVALGLGIFALVMAEFLPGSLLPLMADDLEVSLGAAGQSVAVTAFASALAAVFLPVVLRRADRRRVMIGLMALAVLSNVLVSVAPNLAVLLASRLLLGLALGGFWALAMAMAAHLVPADHLGRALTVINAGVALATVAAVPLGAYLGEVWGWRGVFLLGAGAALLALVAQVATLPPVVPTAISGLAALGSTLRAAVIVFGLVAIALIFSGHFAGFTYLRPAAEHLAGIDAGTLAALLFVYGVANLLGTAASGPLVDTRVRLAVFVFPATLGLAMLLLAALGGSVLALFLATAVWGIGFGGTPTVLQTWAARAEPHRLEQVGGLIVMACNLGIAMGAGLGGYLVDAVTPVAPLLVGGVLVIAGAALVASLRRRP